MLKRKILCITVLSLFVITFMTTAAFAKKGKELKILVAGYGWYRGIPEGFTNNAETIALALHGKKIEARDHKGPKGRKGRVVGRGKVHSIVIPVTWYGAWPPVEEAIHKLKPDIVLGLGTGGSLTMEKFGSNVMNGTDADPEDPSQEVTMDKEPIEPGGPDWREGSLPYDEMVLACLKAGIPARRGYKRGYSNDDPPLPMATPGWYLCNYFAYKGPWYVEQHNLDIDIGFIHLWNRPEYRAWPRLEQIEACFADPYEIQGQPCYDYLMERSHSSSMSIDDTIRAITIALEECVRARVQK